MEILGFEWGLDVQVTMSDSRDEFLQSMLIPNEIIRSLIQERQETTGMLFKQGILT